MWRLRKDLFAKDLFYRLNVFPIRVPALRERTDDIPILAEYLIDRYAKRLGKRITKISKKTLDLEGLVQLHHEMEVGYPRLVTISTDNMLATNEYRAGVGAHWTFLSDPGRKVQKDLD